MVNSYKAKCKHKNSFLSKKCGIKYNLTFTAWIRLAKMGQLLGCRQKNGPHIFHFANGDPKDTISS